MNSIADSIRKKDLLYLIDHTTIQFSFVDRDYIYRIVNKAYTQNFNKPLEQIIGKHVAELLGDDVFYKVTKPFLDRAFRGETIEYEAWFEFTGTKRSYKFVRYLPTHNDNGEIIGVVVSATDMTERKRLEEERTFYEKLMLDQSRMAQIGEMIAFIAHQWRGPLNTLSTYLLRLKNGESIESNSKIFDRCEKILESLSENIEDLYHFYNPSEYKQIVTVKASVYQAVSLLEHRLNLEHIHIEVNIPDACTVDYDNSQLLHVFMIFLENSIDILSKTEQSDKQISIQAQCDDKSMIIDIQDNGDGIRSDLIHNLFEAGVSSKDSQGHGYGLYFARKILSNYLNGDVELLPVTKGACFRITLHAPYYK